MEEGEVGRPAKRAAAGSAAAAGGDGAGPSGAGASGGAPDPAHSSFNRLGLLAKTIKDLQAVLKAWSLPVRGRQRDVGAPVGARRCWRRRAANVRLRCRTCRRCRSAARRTT